MPHLLDDYAAASGRFEPVWTLEIQTLPDDTDRILDTTARRVHHGDPCR